MSFLGKKRVVVTGLGVATSLGANLDLVWEKLISGKSGIKNISLFDPSETDSKIAGEIISGENESLGEINFEKYISSKEASRVDRFIHHAYVASEEAFKDSGLSSYFDENQDQKLLEEKRQRAGVLIGSGIGGLARIEKTAIDMHNFSLERNQNCDKKTNPVRDAFFIPACLINLASGHISIKYKLKGPNMACVTACATGAHAIGDSARLIADGVADIMFCGGTEAAICKLGIAGFAAMKALSTKFNDKPELASRPWTVDRDGFVMGEGAGILILEELEHALARGAKIYAEVVGYGASGDAYHISAPESTGDGGKRAMKIALEMADLKISQIDYLNAHGTSTPLGDNIELNAIKNLFSEEIGCEASIEDLQKLRISSTKSSIGHLLGAAGAVESIFSVLSVYKNQIPPTLNLTDENIEEFAKQFNIVKLSDSDKIYNPGEISVSVSNSFGFGGTNASIVFRKFKK